MSDWNTRTIDEFRRRGGKGVPYFGDRLLLLHVKGRRSGHTRVVPLAFHMDGDRFIVAASKGGAPRHPDWYWSLVTHPDVTMEVGTDTFRVHATPIPKGPERDRLYSDHAEIMPGFRDYEAKTKRIIPVIALERV